MLSDFIPAWKCYSWPRDFSLQSHSSRYERSSLLWTLFQYRTWLKNLPGGLLPINPSCSEWSDCKLKTKMRNSRQMLNVLICRSHLKKRNSKTNVIKFWHRHKKQQRSHSLSCVCDRALMMMMMKYFLHNFLSVSVQCLCMWCVLKPRCKKKATKHQTHTLHSCKMDTHWNTTQ